VFSGPFFKVLEKKKKNKLFFLCGTEINITFAPATEKSETALIGCWNKRPGMADGEGLFLGFDPLVFDKWILRALPLGEFIEILN
jgi:hypothetical protein